jgi:pyruvate/2-oxoglutarate dehydrogenase complex dihydrolipoamide dehydrogenase (E3) component
MSRHYDAIIIGSGQGGGPLSTAFVGAGRKTALIEREHVGGTCVNEGCTPTKTMIASARVAYLAGRSEDYGIHTGRLSVDMARVRQRKRDIVERFRTSSERSIRQGGVDLLMGQARFTSSHSLEIAMNAGQTLELSADTIVIDTGARPSDPPMAGLDMVQHYNSTTVMELDEVPDHLIVVGGGYVGLEFGQMFRRLGSRVTITERAPQLLSHEDPDVAEEVANILRQDGVEVLLEAEATVCGREDDGAIRLGARTSKGEHTVTGSHLLVAVGRSPNTEDLNLEAAGVTLDKRGFVQVNERLETNVPGIYAVGDVAGSPAFTHISYDDFRILRANLLDGGSRSTKDRLVPYTVFIDPQLGRVGLGEKEARAQGREVRVAKMPMNDVARALEVDESRGMMKAVVDAETKQILGCAILGIEGGEIMAMLEIAIMGKLPYTVLRDAIFAHPTLAESFNKLFGTLDS